MTKHELSISARQGLPRRSMTFKLAMPRVKHAAELLILSVVDALLIYLIFRLSSFLRTSLLPHFLSRYAMPLPYHSLLDIWWIFAVWLFFFYYEGLYTMHFSLWDEVRVLWKVSFFATVGIFTIVSIGKLHSEISRTVIVMAGIFGLVLLPPFRLLIKKILRKFGLFRRRILILGAGETGRLILCALRGEPNYGYDVVGFLDDDPEKSGNSIDGVKVHKGVDRADQYINRCGIDDLVLAMPGAGKKRIQEIVNRFQHKVDRLLFVPDMFGVAVLGTNLHHFFHEQAFAFEMKNNLARPLNNAIKKIFDFVVCVALLPFLALPLLGLSLLVRIDSRGPAIFFQERIGKNGRRFRCYKFRTMHEDAEERLEKLLETDPSARSEWECYWKLKQDPRVTRVGRFLRSTSLDELPQVLNVLKGEMSLVGPRPYLPREEMTLAEYRDTILLSKPGITGLWQVSGRSNTSNAYRIALDSWYVRNWNFWLDIVILFKTIAVVIKAEGAR